MRDPRTEPTTVAELRSWLESDRATISSTATWGRLESPKPAGQRDNGKRAEAARVFDHAPEPPTRFD